MMLVPKLARQGAVGPLLLLLVPIALHYFLEHFAQSHYWRDPTSPYFDASRAYTRMYSNVRSLEADAFVNISSKTPFRRTTSNPPYICVGMLTVTRPGNAVYFRTSLGSVVAGLTQEERDGLYIMPFIAHTDQSNHPAYGEAWLENIADRVLEYNASAPNYEHIRDLEAARERTHQPDREKHLADYTYLLRSCAATGAEYILMMEDDVLALHGWYHRTLIAISRVERRTRQKGLKDFFYLRLFYTESLLGWESPEQSQSLRRWWLVGTLLVTVTIVTTLRRNNIIRRHLLILFVVIYGSLFVYISYFFHNGRHSMIPTLSGVHEMPKHGCCAQALVYPKSKVATLASYYEKEKVGFVDKLAEKLADEYSQQVGVRWALTPSPMQHIGAKSSNGDDWGSDKPGEMTEAEKLWNFAFELNDAKALGKEHKKQATKLSSWMQILAQPKPAKLKPPGRGKDG